jgi:signal transduction histidine kinase
MRLRIVGLRRRFLLALLLTSAITLVVTAAVLLSPLQERLREQSAVNLRGAVLASRPEFEKAFREKTAKENLLPLQEVSLELRQRTDGRVLVADSTLVPANGDPPPGFLSDTDPGTPNADAVRVALRSLREERTVTEIEGGTVRVGVRLFDPKRGAVGVMIAQRRLSEAADAVDQVRNALLAAAAVGLLVAVALAVALSNTLLRRLDRLRAAALRMTTEGLDAPIQADTGRDEVGDLARAFAQMQAELRRQEDARRSFVATASHELRTPLTMLQGTMELLEEDLRSGRVDLAEAHRHVEDARRELLRLSSLAGELLDLSRLDASVPLRSEPVELGELARAVGAEFELRAGDRGVRLDVVPPPGPCWARADPDAAARVVRILLDNALRYGPDGEPVRLVAACGPAGATIEVADRGPGIHPAERERIFERFQRGTSGSQAGFGLGLAIGRELAERMGGSLRLTGADSPGASFVLSLPAAAPESPPGDRAARPAAVSS